MERKKNSLGSFDIQFLPGAGGATTFKIDNPGRFNYLKSLTWNLNILNQTLGIKVTEEQLQYLDLYLYIFKSNIEPLGLPFTSISPPAPTNINLITINRTGQYFFNDILFENQINITIAGNNLSAADTYMTYHNLLIEYEESTYFNH